MSPTVTMSSRRVSSDSSEDQEIDVVSSPKGCDSSAAGGQPGARPRSPKCARCRNHGAKVKVKGHKRYCPYEHCVCELCKLILERRRIMAKQVAQRRAQEEDEKMGRAVQDRSDEIVLPPDPPDDNRANFIHPLVQPRGNPSAIPLKPMAFKCAAAGGGIAQEEQPRVESALEHMKASFGTSEQACTTAFMALLKCVAYNLKEAYAKMLEGEVLKEQLEMNSKIDVAQTNVRTLALPLRNPVPVPTTSPTYAPSFPHALLASTAPYLSLASYPNNSWANGPAAWGTWCAPNIPYSGAHMPNGVHHHQSSALAAPLYPFAVGAPPPLSRPEVPSSGDSRGSADGCCSRDDGSDRDAPSGSLESRSSPRQIRFQPYDRNSKKKVFEEGICDDGRIVPCETGSVRGTSEFREGRTRGQPDGSGCSENEQCCDQ